MSSLCDANVPGLHLERIPTWELLVSTMGGGGGSLRTRMQNPFWHFAKSIFFPIFSRETPQGSPPPPQLLEGQQQVRDTETPVALGSGHRRGCLLYWSPEKEEIGQFSSKHNAFLRLEYQKWLVFIVTTGRWHNVYKPSLGPWAEPSLGRWAKELRSSHHGLWIWSVTNLSGRPSPSLQWRWQWYLLPSTVLRSQHPVRAGCY